MHPHDQCENIKSEEFYEVDIQSAIQHLQSPVEAARQKKKKLKKSTHLSGNRARLCSRRRHTFPCRREFSAGLPAGRRSPGP